MTFKPLDEADLTYIEANLNPAGASVSMQFYYANALIETARRFARLRELMRERLEIDKKIEAARQQMSTSVWL